MKEILIESQRTIIMVLGIISTMIIGIVFFNIGFGPIATGIVLSILFTTMEVQRVRGNSKAKEENVN